MYYRFFSIFAELQLSGCEYYRAQSKHPANVVWHLLQIFCEHVTLDALQRVKFTLLPNEKLLLPYHW